MQHEFDNQDEINLLDYIQVIAKHKRLILLITAITVISVGLVSMILPRIYEARAVIIPVNRTGETNEGFNKIIPQVGLASLSGSNTAEIVSLLKSNIVMENVLRKHNLNSTFFGKDSEKKDDARKIWDGIRYLKNRVFTVRDNKKDGIIELSAEFTDPKIASDILNYILSELTDYMSSEAKRVADTNRQYLESLIEKNSDPLIRQKIYALIAKQIETSMLAEVKENFAFKIIDPPKVPDLSIKPRILMNVVLSLIISAFAGIVLAFFLEYVENVKKAGVKSQGGGKEIP